MSNSSILKTETILGYRILDRLGSGGYGEVWSAEAPGGMIKAIKILYGFHDEKKAQTELKSLDRIKQLRHPFLLSLERIEVVDDHLIVVTELADRCLADLFTEYVNKGQAGIPRDELLGYLKQAAEALDFISQEHNLQHLDVKPENLLLVGKHVKLADFGLVKSLHDASQSLMGGLTPAYAAPELFDGRPSLYSDQYSLAIVYQEMLTGDRSFDGTTPAQLASQHMHAQPNLSGLPKLDQATISRALTKKPELRFRSCGEMISELMNRKAVTLEKKRTNFRGRDTVRNETESTDVQIMKRANFTEATQCLSAGQLDPRQRRPVEYVAPPEKFAPSFQLVPTLVIGVGKTGTKICKALKRQIVNTLSRDRQIPSFKMLCLDTDRMALMSNENSDDIALDGTETLALPLRKPEEYRTRSGRHSTWLNRRWIYNVPKSLQTEGLRPLGRLAFADHFDEVYERLAQAIETLNSPESLAISAESIGKVFEGNKIRVFIVTAISGGVGSGLILDLAYTIKLILGQRNLPTDQLNALLIHAENSREKDVGISIANSFGFLTELRHFTAHGYPGDESIGLPPVLDQLPIDFPYYLDLGSNKSALEWQNQINLISEYLFLNTFTQANQYFDSCRALESELDHFALRSFGICTSGLTIENHQAITQVIAESIVDRWLGDRELHPDAHPDLNPPLTDNLFQALEKPIRNAALETLDRQKIQDLINSTVSQLVSNSSVGIPTIDPLLSHFGFPLQAESEKSVMNPNQQSGPIKSTLEKIESETQEFGSGLTGWLSNVWNRQRISFAASKKAVGALKGSLDSTKESLNQTFNHSIQHAHQLARNLVVTVQASKNGKAIPGFDQDVLHLVQKITESLMNAFVNDVKIQVLRMFVRQIDQVAEPVERSRIQLSSHYRGFRQGQSVAGIESHLIGLDKLSIKQLSGKFEELINSAELRFFHDVVQPRGNFREFLVREGINYEHLFELILAAAQQELNSLGRQMNFDQIVIDAAQRDPQGIADQISKLVDRAKPLVDDCGGKARLSIGVPELAPTAMIADSISRNANVKVNVQKCTLGNLAVIAETEDIGISEVCHRLLDKRTDAMELARRLHSRNDVIWGDMAEML